MKTIPFDKTTAKLLGRVIPREEGLWLTHSASGCEFIFTGKKLTLTLGCDPKTFGGAPRCNKPRMAVLVEGLPVVKKVIEDEEETFTVIDSSETVTRRVSVVKLSEMAFSLCRLNPAQTDDQAQIRAAEELPLKISFIGDSITCGYGVDDSNMQSPFATEAENAMKSYCWQACRILGADPELYSYSGHGLISGYTEDGTRNTREILTPWFESVGSSYGRAGDLDPAELPWDFSARPSDVVIINLGTNDNSFCKLNEGGYEGFQEEYLRFIKTVRKCEPSALIVCTMGIMETAPMEQIRRAAELSGDSRVTTFMFTTQDGTLGYGSNWHPSEDTQLRAGKELAEFLAPLLNRR